MKNTSQNISKIEILEPNQAFHFMWEILESIDYSKLSPELATLIKEFEMYDENDIKGMQFKNDEGEDVTRIEDEDIYICIKRTEKGVIVSIGMIEEETEVSPTENTRKNIKNRTEGFLN